MSSRVTPKQILKELYHGTSVEAGVSIATGAMHPSTEGNLGEGVYLTDSLDVASKVARFHAAGGGWVAGYVIEVLVDLGKLKDCGSTPDSDGSWRSRHDAAKRIHGPWPKAHINEDFTEYCVKDVKSIRIVGAYVHHPTSDIQYPIQCLLWKYFVTVDGNKYLDNHGKMIWQAPSKSSYLDSVGTKFHQIHWEIRDAGENMYYIINSDKMMHLDGQVKNGEKVKLWVGKKGIADLGTATQFIKWQFIPTARPNEYFILNVGKQMWLDSNGMSLWKGKNLEDKGAYPLNISWKLVPAMMMM